jgi:stage II sporulation protein M
MKDKKKVLHLREQFKEAKSYLKESYNYIHIALGVFVLSTILGFALHNQLTFIDDLLKQLVDKTAGLNTGEMVFFILQNNLQSALFSVFFGIFFGIFPLTSNISNGIVLGYVLQRSYEVVGILSWWRILPHGVFELPAIFISFALGMKLGFTLFLDRKIRYKEFRRRLYNSVNTFLMIVIPLLIIAAIIEGVLIGVLN